jgi:hypothetical protein
LEFVRINLYFLSQESFFELKYIFKISDSINSIDKWLFMMGFLAKVKLFLVLFLYAKTMHVKYKNYLILLI